MTELLADPIIHVLALTVVALKLVGWLVAAAYRHGYRRGSQN